MMEQLTDLESYYLYAGAPESDNADEDLIIFLIEAVSNQIRSYTGRYLNAKTFVERHSAYGDLDLILDQYPVIGISRLAYGNDLALSVTCTDENATKKTVNVTADAVILRYADDQGEETTTTLAFEDYPSTTLLVDAINAVDNWEATLTTNTLSRYLAPIVSNKSTVQLRYPGDDWDAFRYEAAEGWLVLERRCNEAPYRQDHWLVEYEAGYDPIPADLQLLANQLVSQAVQNINKATISSDLQTTGMIVEESIGDYKYKLGDLSADTVNEEQISILNKYAKIRIGKRR